MPLLCFNVIDNLTCQKRIEYNHKLYAYNHHIEYIQTRSILDIQNFIKNQSETIFVISNQYIFYNVEFNYKDLIGTSDKLGLFQKSSFGSIDNNLFVIEPCDWSINLLSLWIEADIDFNNMINKYIVEPNQILQNINVIDKTYKITVSDFINNPLNTNKPLCIDMSAINDTYICNFVNQINTILGIHDAT